MVAIVITSNLKLADAPGNIYLSRAKSCLNKDSVANVSQIITLDKNFLIEEVGMLDSSMLRQVDEGLQLVLSL